MPPSPNLRSTCVACALLGGLSGAALVAQTAPPAPAADPVDEPIVLSAFEVNSTKDTAYRVQNSVATTGVAQQLVSTPLPITVITNEFMRDAGLEGFTGALAYASSITLDPHTGNGNYAPGFGRGNSQPNGTRFRGQPYNGTFRNGLRLPTGFDTENVDRIEVAKGPMAVFVGGATLGGEVNVVTKKPQFNRKEEVTVRIGSHDYYRFSVDATGPINDQFAYRVIFDYNDKNTWRDWSHSQSVFMNPQVTWNITDKLTTRFDGYYRKGWGNLVSQNVSSTQNYQDDYNNPSAGLLALGTRRTTGAGAGQPYTIDEYRQRIGQAFGTWRQDVFDATGQWVGLGDGEDLIEGPAPTGRRYNWYGPNAEFEEPVWLFENETTLVATDWFQARAMGRYMEAKQHHDYYSFGQRVYAAGNTPLSSGSATRQKQTSEVAKLEGVLKKAFWIFDGTLLLGGEYSGDETRVEDAFFDYSGLSPVPGSPNVGFSPATLTGSQIYQYFDPRVHAFPDTRLVTRWPSEVRAPGQLAYSYSKSIFRTGYSAASLGIWDNRITFTGGVRRARGYSVNASLDPAEEVVVVNGVPQTSAQKPAATDSWMYGASVRVIKGLYAYASYNRGESTRGGSLVSRVSFGNAPLDIVSAAEQAANPAPNDIGTGKEAGLKFEFFDRKLTGSVGWFQLTRGNILVSDIVRSSADPRNVGTELDTNPDTTNPGVRGWVQWLRPIDGNISEGFETDLVWTPTPNYSLVLGASHLTTNEITVNRPPTSDPVQLREYTVVNGRPLDLAPDDMIRVFQRYVFTSGTLKGASIGAGVRYQSSFMPQGSSVNWGLVFPGYTVGDLVLGYDTRLWGRNVAFTLNVDNVTNSTYIEGQRVFGAPREFFLSMRIDL
ncbi:MAG TPA: TonB-dependent receptor plug domain-containing protein [Opitutaceae bacterium]